ncbi:MAG: polysaccharide deacetylase family protein [Bacteroidales bacterium]|nr:polysaccharide deacetylase family protein [Bacteroidales bacterium]
MIERPPLILRLIMRGALFRMPQAPGERTVYLTFDDGPIPQATPWVLGCLREHGAKATFFMVADNARRYPQLVEQVVSEGHAVGNHTMHHIQGLRTPTAAYLADAKEALQYLPAGAATLFRPPHGLMRPSQRRALLRAGRIVLYDVLTRDYAPAVTAADIERTVRRLVRPGSIIVLHDSLRSIHKLRTALPRLLSHLTAEGYTFGLLN